MEIKDLEQIFELLKQNDITEFELNKEGMQLKLSRAKPEMRLAPSAYSHAIEPAITQGYGQNSGNFAPAGSFPAGQSSAQPALSTAVSDNFTKVESPLVGTFYRKASPDSNNYVEEGSLVKKGDTLCIVEAMKLMNEIDAPVSGTVQKILVGDGDVVEFGEVMFLIKPSS